jgi:CBS domain containing-hemolysin-like protein
MDLKFKPCSSCCCWFSSCCIDFFFSFRRIIAKRIGLNHPEAIAKAVALPMKIVSIVTAPFIWLLTHSTDFLLNVLQIKPTADGKVTEEEIKR